MGEQECSVSAHAILKARTAAAHAAIDADFSRFDLGCRDAYVRFLLAHARVLPAIEGILAREPGLPQWRRRTDLLLEDLRASGRDLPDPIIETRSLDLAEKFGLLYVVEGSRLGGRLLSRRVGRGFSKRFLSAAHLPGEWRALITALEGRAGVENGPWLEGVVAGASRGFDLYALSALQELSRSPSGRRLRGSPGAASARVQAGTTRFRPRRFPS